MTVEEAIEALGGLVSRAGGEGDDALDVVKDALSAARAVRVAFDAGDWPLGSSYKAVQDALREFDAVLRGG